MGRNSTQYVITGTKFLRLASRAILGEYGTNLQNIEKSARKIYWADEGKILNQRDQSGAEALIVAYLCQNGQFRELFLHGIKPHVFVALHLFKDKWKHEFKGGIDIKPDFDELCRTPISELKKNPFWKEVDSLIKSSDNWSADKRYYYISKQVCHSSNYGIRAGMFVLNTLEKSKGKIVLSKKDAEFFLEMYHSLFPEIRQWHREVENQVRSTGMLYNLQGNPIAITGNLDTENSIKECLAAIPQSTVAMITRNAYTSMQLFIETTIVKWDLLADTHDSYLVQSPIEEHLECHKIMKQYLEPELTSPRGEKFKMKSEGASGFNWCPYHATKNPEGLKEVNI